MISGLIGGACIGLILVLTLPLSIAIPGIILGAMTWGVFCGINDLP